MLDLILCCYKHPEVGTLVPKHIGVFTYNAMCLMFCVFCTRILLLLHSVGEYIECKQMHGMNNRV